MPQTIIRREEEHLYAEQPRTKAGQELGSAILHLRRLENVQEVRALRSSGMSNLDLRALRYIVQASRDQRSLSPKNLIVMLGTSSANVTNVIERLVKKALVERVNHPTDRRAHYLRPTEAAVAHVEQAFGNHHSTLVAAIDRLGDDEARIAAGVISRIADALDDLPPGE